MSKDALSRGKFIGVFCGQRFSLWQVSKSDGKKKRPSRGMADRPERRKENEHE